MVSDRNRRTARFDQRMFRYGQAALAHQDWKPVRRLWRENPAPRDDIQPGLMLVQKGAATDSALLWVGLVAHDADWGTPGGPAGETVDVQVTLTGRDDPGLEPRTETVTLHWFDVGAAEREITQWHLGTRFFHGHLRIENLTADRWYTATASPTSATLAAELGTGPLPVCQVRTLPSRLEIGERLSVFTASCYDADTDRAGDIGAGYEAAFAEHSADSVPRPDMSWFTGDAIYADAPWWLYGTMARHTPRTYGLLEYWSAWGMQRRAGLHTPGGRGREALHPLLTNGPNWFLPDDHEFWNNWPHATVLARHSYRNRVRGAHGRVFRWLADRRDTIGDDAVGVPRDPGSAPRNNRAAQNYLPVHPDEWGTWARAAFDLFGSFQTPSVRDRDTGRISWGARDDNDEHRPPRTTPRYEVHRPLNQLLQTVEVDPIRVALLDTRTRRVRKFHHPLHSTFVDTAALEQLIDYAREAPILFLVLAQPVLRKPVRCVPGKHARESLRTRLATQDRGIEDYCHQYQRFWTDLIEARAGRPTITVGGDIHRSYVAHAPALSLVEVVASPMSLVTGLAMLDGPRDAVRKVRGLWARPEADEYAEGGVLLDDVADLFKGPDDLPPPSLRPGVGRGATILASLPGHGDGNPGFATLLLDRRSDRSVRLEVTLRPRGRAGRSATPCRRVVFDLSTEPTGEPSVIHLSGPEFDPTRDSRPTSVGGRG